MNEVLQLATPEVAAAWLRERGCTRLSSDSKELQPGDAFLAWRGKRFDSRELVPDLLRTGRVCLVDSAPDGPQLGPHALLAGLADLRASAGHVADAFHARPSSRLQVVAVTGTNGKTSTAWWLSQALTENRVIQKEEQTIEKNQGQAEEKSDKKPLNCLMIGTLGVGQPPALGSAELTTPDALRLHRWISDAVGAGASSVVMEASSVGLVEHRLAGLSIDVAVFTNFTQDHLDYHGTMAAYWEAKRSLFDWRGLRAAVINIDDAKGAELRATLSKDQPTLALWTVSLSAFSNARLTASELQSTPEGMRFLVTERDGVSVASAEVQASAFGEFNASNLLGVVAAQRALDVPLQQAAAVAARLLPVPGRMERVVARGATKPTPLVLVDYAHTPDALAQVLAALRPVAQQRAGRLHCVFGCGGDRDRSKRPLMAQAVEQGADTITLTQDNPRTEPVIQIESDVLAGFSKRSRVNVVTDRARAIEQTIFRARGSDVVLIAGKGHEAYQEIMGFKHPFSDQAVARAALQAISEEVPA